MTGYVPESIPKMNRLIYPSCGFLRCHQQAFMSNSPSSFCGPIPAPNINAPIHGNIYGVCPVGPATYGSFSEPR